MVILPPAPLILLVLCEIDLIRVDLTFRLLMDENIAHMSFFEATHPHPLQSTHRGGSLCM